MDRINQLMETSVERLGADLAQEIPTSRFILTIELYTWLVKHSAEPKVWKDRSHCSFKSTGSIGKLPKQFADAVDFKVNKGTLIIVDQDWQQLGSIPYAKLIWDVINPQDAKGDIQPTYQMYVRIEDFKALRALIGQTITAQNHPLPKAE